MLRVKKSNTFYGEYSLKTWILLLLNKEIVLPEYQRSFVWSIDMAIMLFDSLHRGIFTPPVIIAADRDAENCVKNLILDGQQRLSSILLYFLGYWPNKKERVQSVINEDNEEGEVQDVLTWNINEIQNLFKKCSTVEELKKILSNDSNYISIEELIQKNDVGGKLKRTFNSNICTDSVLCTSYLGFSYITGLYSREQTGALYFSEVFRRINSSGKSLSAAESRAAYYWLQPGKVNFFVPNQVKKITVSGRELDWVRSLAFVAEVYKSYGKRGVVCVPEKLNFAAGCSNNFESYFEKYVINVMENSAESDFAAYSKEQEDNIKLFFEGFDRIAKYEFPSLVDADLYVWGLMYWAIFHGKSLKQAGIASLKSNLDNKISVEKMKSKKDPNRIGNIRSRMSVSINEYKKFIEE